MGNGVCDQTKGQPQLRFVCVVLSHLIKELVRSHQAYVPLPLPCAVYQWKGIGWCVRYREREETRGKESLER